MQSFRSELENPVVEKDIIDLEKKIRLFHGGELDEEKFKSLRLARGVYGQRQPGVQMVRIKLPYGRVTTTQLNKIADLSEEYATGNLHATTRLDIQLHFVKLDDTPYMWSKLEEDDVTMREACGNTVRNVTASSKAGVDPNEPFDVSPYAHNFFQFFLRNPICQEMGRKFKVAFSSSDEDTGLTFMHDIGFIPKIKEENGEQIRGFKVVFGGGLSAQPQLAYVAHEFLPEDQIIPFAESVLRVFDRYGERNKRQKARFKFLIKSLGVDEVRRLMDEEYKALKAKSYPIDTSVIEEAVPPQIDENLEAPANLDEKKYQSWLKSNTFKQKQQGYYGAYVKLINGDMQAETARKLAGIVKKYAADDMRISVEQNYLIRFVPEKALPNLFAELDELGLAEPGVDSTADVTSCPGTDTCNLGISNSTGIAKHLANLIQDEYPDMIQNKDLKIKISGCPNACGQHTIANIGFHGSSMKDQNKLVLPAVQVLLGGGVLGNGEGRIAEKVIKLPSKRGDQALRTLIDDYEDNAHEGEYYNDYYDRQGKMYFYELLKPIADTSDLKETDYIDWGHEEKYQVITKAGECAGVVIDLVQTLIYESEEKLQSAHEALDQGVYADAIYHAYNVFLGTAKALLTSAEVKTNTHMTIMNGFDEHFVDTGKFLFENSFTEHVLSINKYEPTKDFATQYINSAYQFLDQAKTYRDNELKEHQENSEGVAK